MIRLPWIVRNTILHRKHRTLRACKCFEYSECYGCFGSNIIFHSGWSEWMKRDNSLKFNYRFCDIQFDSDFNFIIMKLETYLAVAPFKDFIALLKAVYCCHIQCRIKILGVVLRKCHSQHLEIILFSRFLFHDCIQIY